MADRLGVNRASVTGIDAKTLRNSLRMTVVASAGIGVLVALPGWLRDLEHATPQISLQEAVPPRVVSAPVVAVSGQPRREVRHREARYQVLADFLAKRYRVSRDTLERFVRLAYAAGNVTQVDPLLILAVMAVESSFNPVAESVVGAKGLMQIMPQYHQDKLRLPHGGEANVLDPEVNIIAGAKVLREYATKTGEDIVAALRLYAGVGSDLENPYPRRVLSERERLEEILRRVQDRQAASRAPSRADQA